jgi:Dolichyl-phosphate-mannose-protein mannosyltransferase
VVRLPFIALFGLSTWLMYRFTAALYTPPAGLWAAVTMNLAPVFGITTGGWVLPDGPLDCALLGAALCLVRALPGQGTRGATLVAERGPRRRAGVVRHISGPLIPAGAFLYLVIQPRYRRWLRPPGTLPGRGGWKSPSSRPPAL